MSVYGSCAFRAWWSVGTMSAFSARDLAGVLMTDEGRKVLETAVTTIQVRVQERNGWHILPDS